MRLLLDWRRVQLGPTTVEVAGGKGGKDLNDRKAGRGVGW
jgi:hypothetical protein